MEYIAGVDEAGRGPLAGPVVAAAVILNSGSTWITELNDSKKLSAHKRDILFDCIMAEAQAVGIGQASVEEIDRLNILQATFLAMTRAVEGLCLSPTEVWVDGNRAPTWSYPTKTIIGGDALEPAIQAASIIAKVTRDRQMCAYDVQYPGYGFAVHKGYGTVAHRRAITQLGRSAIHRQSFTVKEVV